MANIPTQSFDFIIVGGGVAGLRAAIGLAGVGRVLVLTKAEEVESNTGYAQGGIAAALGPDDSPDLHATDTLRAGDGLCDEAAVRVLVEEGPRYVRELISWGASFDRDANGELALGLEAAHSVRRILHVGDTTGRTIGRAMWEQVRPLNTVTTISHALVTDLVVESGHIAGVRYFDRSGVRACRAGTRHPAGHWRRRPGLQRDDESRRSPPATASLSPTTRARASPIWSSCSSIRPRSRRRMLRDF